MVIFIFLLLALINIISFNAEANTVISNLQSTDYDLVLKTITQLDGDVDYSKGSVFDQIRDKLMEIAKNPIAADVVREEAIFALEKMPADDKVISYFGELIIDQSKNSAIRMCAARYLGRVGSEAYPVVDSLFENLAAVDENMRVRIARVFQQTALNNTGVITKLTNIISNNSDDNLKLYVLNILSSIGDKASQSAADIAKLIKKTANKEIQAAALRTLLQIAPDNSDLIEILENYSNNSDSNLRRIALQGLNQEDNIEIVHTEVPAFPGAEGYGRYTAGGRGGDVYVVTNLNDKGPESLRNAVEASGPRTIVFAVSGNIMLEKPLNINNPYITIAGQTAPGDGITIAGYPVNIGTNNVIIRYIRVRLGDYNRVESDSIGGRRVSDIILDHVSASWSVDETVSFYLTKNVTVQWSFITESLWGSIHHKGAHGYGGIWGGASSFHHNLMAHHSSRNPRFDGDRDYTDPATDMRNNVIYNWGFNSTYGGEGGNHNMIANYYKPGPATRSGSVKYRIVEVSNGGKWYVADNYVDGFPRISDDNWSGGVQPRENSLDEIKKDVPFPVPDVNTDAAEIAYQRVLAGGGVTLPVRDTIDKRIVEEVRTGTATYGGEFAGPYTGIIDSQRDVGGLPFLRSFPAPADSDRDGLPDWWVINYGFNPVNGIAPSGDFDGDGFTNMEEYLNGTNPVILDLF